MASSSRSLLEHDEVRMEDFVERIDSVKESDSVESLEDDVCLICLGTIQDRTILPECRHSLFCFTCIMKWINIHQRCPLCSKEIGQYVIHSIRSDDDYIRHKLPEKVKGDSDPSFFDSQIQQRATRSVRQQRQQSDQRDYRQEALERWERQLSIRRRVYRQSLYCKHVGTNRSSRLAEPATPRIISNTPSLQSTLLSFIRRELIAFPRTNLDIDFLSTYSLTIFKSLDVKSNESITLLSEFLGFDGAQHFCHEIYTFLRFISAGSGTHPNKLVAFDTWARYDWPEDAVSKRLLARRMEAESMKRSHLLETTQQEESS